MSTIVDRRSDQEKADTTGFIVATDRVLSGWGQAPGRSFFALPFRCMEEAIAAEKNLRARPCMLRVRIVGRNYRPRLRTGDHLSIASMSWHRK